MADKIADTSKSESDFFDSFTPSEELIPIPAVKNLGTSYLDFDGLLDQPGLRVHEDGGATGCGGKLWPAGELLSRYMIRNGVNGRKNILELGSGTGLVGLAIALNEKNNDDLNIWVTDQENMVPLMDENIQLNNLTEKVKAKVLNWGDDLPQFTKDHEIDLVLAADCVYLEAAFPLLEKTLLDLTEKNVPVLMCYKKRRKADARFFKAMRKNFLINEIKNHEDYEKYFKQSVHLYEILRK